MVRRLVLLVVVASIAAFAASVTPDVQRYLRMRRM